MPESNPNHSLSEISHLFLSSVRDKATGGAARPVRVPPPKASSIDMSPEEFAQVFGAGEDEPAVTAPAAAVPNDRGSGPVHSVSVVIANHLNGKQFDRIKDYARHLASQGTRIGLIEVDPSEFRVMCFDRCGEDDAPVESPVECFDPRQMHEVLEELSWDVQKWLLVLPQPRVPEARVLLRGVKHWALLSTCDHDGVIACYRTLKGLTDLWPTERSAEKPRLSLALLDAADADQAERVSSKLTSVCQQFLNWPLDAEPAVQTGSAVENVSEHMVMFCRPTRDKGQLATAPQWEIVADFIARSKVESSEAGATNVIENLDVSAESAKTQAAAWSEPKIEIESRMDVMTQEEVTAPAAPPIVDLKPVAPTADSSDVIDLPGPELEESGIVDAILKHCSGELVECPIAPPMCPKAKLAVSRDRRIVMLAVSRQGLADLNTIGQAYRWLQENQNLIGMAVPQLSIDTHQPPHLSLLINQADSTAQTLQPMLQGNHVTVKTYRKLRWGGKTGLLLEAA